MTGNLRPSPFFSCGKMNLVILGVCSTRMGLTYRKTGILTMIQHGDCFVIHFLLWNWWGIVGISSIYGLFRRIPKQHVAGWYSPILLVQTSGHQLKYGALSMCWMEQPRDDVCKALQNTHQHTHARVYPRLFACIFAWLVTCDMRSCGCNVAHILPLVSLTLEPLCTD